MGDHSQEEQALMKIQHEWAEARVKGDSSYTRRIEADDCTYRLARRQDRE